MSDKTYKVNEIYYTIQGEGVRWGTPMVFVRFALCNLSCGFCDTEFESFELMTQEQIIELCDLVSATDNKESETCKNVLFCGGEPLLSLDNDLLSAFKAASWYIAIETNGTQAIPDLVDWSVCSPKVAEHALVPEYVNELKYVRGYKQGIPRPRIKADHYLISPMFSGNDLDKDVLEWCVSLVKRNPQWRLTIQHHKVSFGNMR